uniref:Spindle and centriole-associated protein 1 n=1 Tax=Mola mola TaxID=94237 RepID=A0A3Q3W504_MOLML
MSFVRVGRPTQQHTKGKRPVRTKRAAAPKKDWVSTVNDLSVHKPTPAELVRLHRHEIHKSHNKAAAQWELREKALQRRLRHSGSHAPLDQASLSIIREVFSDKLLLQDVLARSDRAMAVVKDLFGDAPQRQTGHPSVTMAPNSDSDSALLPVLQREDPPTQLSLLSQSIMDQQVALPKKKEEKHVLCIHHKDSNPSHLVSALNATVAVQRVQSRRRQSEEGKEEPSVLVSQVLNPELHLNQSEMSENISYYTSSELNGTSMASLSGDHSSLGLLQAMLGQVEADLDTLSPDTDPTSARCQEPHRKQGLTGFSVALVSTLGRLVNLLKQKEGEAHKEAWERKRLEEDLREQRGLIDALTAETMTLREEAAALQARLQQQIAELEQKLDTVVLVMGDTGLLKPPGYPHQDSDIIPAGAFCVCVLAVNNKVSKVSHKFIVTNSASSLTSLPLSSLPFASSVSLLSDPLGSEISPEAMLAEIAQLSRENDLIKAQLSQAKGPGSVCGGLPSNGSLSCLLAKESSLLSTVEQRLLELNRQSAAARGRLLELIEQQKQNVSARVSPSGSPIPTSAISPQTAGMVAQSVEKRREKEGWFSLSAHVR